MLVYGTANPVGYGDEDYEGLYLTERDLQEITPTIVGIPVKIEHKGGDVGRVVSAWRHGGKLDLVLDIDGEGLESVFGREFVKKGLCKDLSLGYNVQMSRSPAGFLKASTHSFGLLNKDPYNDGVIKASNKRVVEVSLVRVGAREDCHIHGWSALAGGPQAGAKKGGAVAGHVILP